MKLVFLGPPGAGKGTQAKIYSQKHKIAHISTGEMLRAAVQAGSPLGIKVKSVIDSGQLVSDELIIELIRDRVKESDCSGGYILDGFPRTVKQAEALERLLKETGVKLDSAVLFDLPVTAIMERLANRRSTESRADDTENVQLERQKIYLEQTAPLIDYYKNSGLLKTVDASGSIEQVGARLEQSL